VRILVAGQYAWDQQEPSFCRGLRAAGVDVHELHAGGPWDRLDALRRAQMKYVFGPQVATLNARLLAATVRLRPTVILAYRTSWVWPSTVRAVRRMRSRVVLYNNDDPFGHDRDDRPWRRFRALIPHADACFAYRPVNLEDYRRAGARRVFLMRSWYSPETHRPIELTRADRERFESDVTFVGHYEDDGRLEALRQVVATGLRVRVFGGGWDRAVPDAMSVVGRPHDVLGDDYARAIRAAKIALVFLSTRNRDQYTRRCFEIPAIGTMMLAPRTAELASMYEENAEAIYFGSPGELVAKALAYTGDVLRRERVAAAGRARCMRDGHDVNARARQFLRDLETFD
jgi:spore maturation protein CgeB